MGARSSRWRRSSFRAEIGLGRLPDRGLGNSGWSGRFCGGGLAQRRQGYSSGRREWGWGDEGAWRCRLLVGLGGRGGLVGGRYLGGFLGLMRRERLRLGWLSYFQNYGNDNQM